MFFLTLNRSYDGLNRNHIQANVFDFFEVTICLFIISILIFLEGEVVGAPGDVCCNTCGINSIIIFERRAVHRNLQVL